MAITAAIGAVQSASGQISAGTLPGVDSFLSNTLPNGVTSYINTLVGRTVVVPNGTKGIGGFVFDYTGEQRATLQAQITDHYAEDNRAIEDHVAFEPVRLTIRGFVAELTYVPSQGLLGLVGGVQSKLTAIPAYLGKYTPGAVQTLQKASTQAQSTINSIQQAAGKINNLVGLLPGATPTGTKQAQAYAKLEALYYAAQTFSVVMPWKVYSSMVIEHLDPVQPEETNDWTEWTVTLKQIRLASIQAIPYYLSAYQGRAAQQQQGPVNQGKTAGASIGYQLLQTSFPSLAR